MDKNCVNCTHPGRDCIPYLMTFTNAELLEWAKMRRVALHLSYEELSEKSGVPLSTIERMMSRKGTDCRFGTAQPVIRVLSGCSAEELDCECVKQPDDVLKEQLKAKEEIIRHLEEENQRKNGVIDHLHATAKEDIERAKDEESESIAYMKKKEKSYLRLICALSIALAVALLVIIAALVSDKLDPTKGFFWLRSWLSSMAGIKA